MMPGPELLREAEEYLRAGRPDAARTLLVAYLKARPNSEQAWLLLSSVVSDPRQKMDCLQRVLKINPRNVEAQTRLDQLVTPPRPARPVRPSPTVTPAPAPPSASTPTPAADPSTSALADALAKTLAETTLPQKQPFRKPEPEVIQPPTISQPTPAAPAATAAPADAPAKTTPALSQPFREPELETTQPTPSEPTLAATTAPQPDGPAFIEEEPHAEKRKPSRLLWIVAAIVGTLVLCAVGTVGVFFALQNFVPTPVAAIPTSTPGPTSTPAATVTSAFPTFPPTYTPTNTPTITPTPSITPTPTRPQPNPTVLDEMDTIQQQVADLRGLTILNTVPSYVIEKEAVRETLERLYLENGGSKEDVEDQAHTLSALGLMKPTYDLYTNALNGLGDGLGGFYIPGARELYVIGEQFNGIEKFVFSHEFNHALSDQHFDFNGLGVMPVCEGDAQRCQAIRALIEGDSTLLMSQWLEQYAGPQEVIDILNYSPPASVLPEEFPPPYAVREAAFPYSAGLTFVEYLYDRGSWAEVNQAYETPPQSTEQILHPEKYTDRELPIEVIDAPLGEVLGGEWRLLDQNSLGEFRTYLLLGYGADVAAQLPDAAAEDAAAGWGGDGYQSYYNDATDQTVLAVHWVWDTKKESDQFFEAMAQYQDARFRGLKVDRSDGQCWEANNEASCVFSIGKESLWLLAPNQTILNLMLIQFPDFLQ